ncbi:MAG: DUF1259 domain-containing protein, partial [Acidobacteriota bacterium]
MEEGKANNPREDHLTVVGITIGDAAGIGPEVSLKAVADEEIRSVCRPVLIGDLRSLKHTSSDLGLGLDLVPFDEENTPHPLTVEVFDTNNLPDTITVGRDDLKLTEMGAPINARMGLNTWAAFVGTNENAAIAGDVAMLANE